MLNTFIFRLKAFLAAVVIVFGLGTTTATAQQGPPEHVRRSVDAVFQMLNATDAASIDSFVETAMKDGAVANLSEFTRRLQQIRHEVQGLRDDVSVEADPDGVRLVLSSGNRERVVRIVLDEAGISDVMLLPEPSRSSQGTPEDAIRGHIRALETSGHKNSDQLLAEFETTRWSRSFIDSTTAEARRELLQNVQAAARNANGILLDQRGDEVVLTLEGATAVEVRLRLEESAPFKISGMAVEEVRGAAEAISLSRENIDSVLDGMAARGFSGVLRLNSSAGPRYERAVGFVDRSAGRASDTGYVFGIGSTPIDFTAAAVLLLEDAGRINLDDPVSKYFEGVPADKSAMTIRHLLTGQSGLPDFHGLPTDGDQDLAWIDRGTAERRILGQELIFSPGADRANSHSAYVLLAALVERVSGQEYYDFLKKSIFEPAGMRHTGMYGMDLGLPVETFAVGGGPNMVGDPNIPPNWGRTSWLIMGSGGMFSTLDDMQRFYDWGRSNPVAAISARYNAPGFGVGGSDRGFYFVHVYNPNGEEAFLMANVDGRSLRAFTDGLRRMILGD
ncbi:MAG: serine hydrolase domain-containing protein [Blastomonas sp.]